MSWPARLSRLLGLEGLGAEGAAVNAARSLTDDRRASSHLDTFLRRMPHPNEVAVNGDDDRPLPAEDLQ